jgi:Cu+-exporting ATPase
MTHERTDGGHGRKGHKRIHADQEHDRGKHHASEAGASGCVKDLVFGMTVDPHTTPHPAQHSGQTFYCCSDGCRSRFEASPARYIDPATAPARGEVVTDGTIYTCPMRYKILQIGPGSCPIYGTALEPILATADTDASEELVDITRRFRIGLALTLPIVALEMVSSSCFAETCSHRQSEESCMLSLIGTDWEQWWQPWLV